MTLTSETGGRPGFCGPPRFSRSLEIRGWGVRAGSISWTSPIINFYAGTLGFEFYKKGLDTVPLVSMCFWHVGCCCRTGATWRQETVVKAGNLHHLPLTLSRRGTRGLTVSTPMQGRHMRFNSEVGGERCYRPIYMV